MISRMTKGLTFALLPLALLSCGASNWVQLTSAGRQVTLAVPSQVTNCIRVGTSRASALNRVGFIQRGNEKLQEELVTLARNEAGDMGGNRVVAESTIVDGTQSFGVYRCP
jgi:hypothetical protein